jgi:hypothetical protein
MSFKRRGLFGGGFGFRTAISISGMAVVDCGSSNPPAAFSDSGPDSQLVSMAIPLARGRQNAAVGCLDDARQSAVREREPVLGLPLDRLT